MKSLGEYWRLDSKDQLIIALYKEGAKPKKIRKATGLSQDQLKKKLAKLRRLGKL